ncbi:hypothetical protein J6590_088371 [Homalodisca vitripennis]|nr:hypothetical protein J6590_089391 [Homalodisca vitripennis]KAG8329350.1 hypothetical protein J6590_088371 [Homalodisca vitripennis]
MPDQNPIWVLYFFLIYHLIRTLTTYDEVISWYDKSSSFKNNLLFLSLSAPGVASPAVQRKFSRFVGVRQGLHYREVPLAGLHAELLPPDLQLQRMHSRCSVADKAVKLDFCIPSKMMSSEIAYTTRPTSATTVQRLSEDVCLLLLSKPVNRTVLCALVKFMSAIYKAAVADYLCGVDRTEEKCIDLR